MNELPESCIDCAEYGSEFCDDCMKELMEMFQKRIGSFFLRHCGKLPKKILTNQKNKYIVTIIIAKGK